MDIARVIGKVVASQKVDSLQGISLLILEPLNENLQAVGAPVVASDSTNRRGPGELVYYVASGDAVYTGPDGMDIPVDAAIIGIVDSMHISTDG